MCEPASMIIVKSGKVYWSQSSESHEDIIAEFNLEHLDTMRDVQLVRMEITPPDRDLRKPLEEWRFKVDQDMLPDWWWAGWAEELVRQELTSWLTAKVVLTNQEVKEVTGNLLAVYGTVQEVWDGGTVQEVYGGGTVIAYTKLDPSILKHPNAVLVDRSGETVQVFAGKED